MANKTDDNRRAVMAVVESHGWHEIGGHEWHELRETVPGVPESGLRKILIECGSKIAQPWRGLDIHSLDGLEETLTGLAFFYETNPKAARTMVIAAKDKARFAARNVKAAPEKRALKMEMVDWMLVWLGDPAMFGTWVRLRKQQLNPEKRFQL